MTWKIQFKKVRFVKLRLILSAVLLVLVIVLLVSIFSLLFNSKNEMTEITKKDYEFLQIDQVVCGNVEDVIAMYEDDETNNYMVLTENNKVLVFRAPMSSGINHEMKELLQHRRSSVRYRGKVHGITERSLALLNLNAISMGLTINNNLKGNAHDYSVGNLVDITYYENSRQDHMLTAYIVCTLFFLVVIFLLLRKLINNAIYSIAVQKGYLTPELKVKKEELHLDNTATYQHDEQNGEYFYVGTGESSLPDKAVPPSPAPQNPASDPTSAPGGDYYSSSVNEDGNFYVSGSSNEQDVHGTNSDRTYHY